MKAGEIAEQYLQAHNEYVDALKALLNDLDLAWRAGEKDRCDLLCDAMIHMQRMAREREEN
jgi:hypothetical protein